MTSSLLKRARTGAGISQRALAALARTSHATISTYENGQKSPSLDTTARIVNAAGYDLDLVERPRWTKVQGARGQQHIVPDRLSRLPLGMAYASFIAPKHLDWSHPGRRVDLSDPYQRRRWYEVVIREGTKRDVQRYIDGALLIDAWPDMVVPHALQAAWSKAIIRSKQSNG